MNHEFGVYKAQRDEYEQKLEKQLAEMKAIHSSLHTLEHNHNILIQHYQGEVARLQQEARSKGLHLQASQPPTMGTVAGPMAKRPRDDATALASDTRSQLQHHDHQALPSPQQLQQQQQQQQAQPQQAPTQQAQAQAQAPQHDWSYEPLDGPVKVELSHTLQHDSIVCCVKYSNDGRYVAAGCNRVAYLYDAATGLAASPSKFQDSLPADTDSYVRSVCFSADNSCLITGAEDKTVKVWDIASGRIKRTFGGETGHTLDIYSLDCSADGRIIASGSGDKTVKLWSMDQGNCVHTLGNVATYGPTDGVTSVAISPDGSILAAGSLDKCVRLWDISTGQFITKLGGGNTNNKMDAGHTDSVYSVAFSPDGKYLASGSLDHSLMLWDVAAAKSYAGVGGSCMLAQYVGHTDFVLSVAFNVDGSLLISVRLCHSAVSLC
jgi:glucose repression regulatory protein TUP1